MIEVQRLTKAFGSRRVLQDVTFKVGSGSMVAITGPSGSGKTTLLNCVGLLDRPDSGEIAVGGRDVLGLNRRNRTTYFRHVVGYLFQNYALLDNETVDANLNVACAYSKREGNKKDWKAEALHEVGLDDMLDAKIYELSGGEQQRVAIARLLIRRPPVVLADEPTGALDADNRDVTMELLTRMRDTGAAILVVTHDRNVVGYCDDHLPLGSSTETGGSLPGDA